MYIDHCFRFYSLTRAWDPKSKMSNIATEFAIFAANVFGLGCYFAKNSVTSASDTYSTPDANGHKYVIQARVITGESCQGVKDMKILPYKNGKDGDQYDSAVDNIANPDIFVVFRDASAYPEYVVKFQ